MEKLRRGPKVHPWNRILASPPKKPEPERVPGASFSRLSGIIPKSTCTDVVQGIREEDGEFYSFPSSHMEPRTAKPTEQDHPSHSRHYKKKKKRHNSNASKKGTLFLRDTEEQEGRDKARSC